jgi:hypothetical protein
MKYFIDTEFHEGFNKPLFGRNRHFIDLISIGIVAEDGRKYYAICKDFDLNAAWNNDWLRENVLKQIHAEMCGNESTYAKTYHYHIFAPFNKKSIELLLNWQGKGAKQIAEEVKQFVYAPFMADNPVLSSDNWYPKDVEFYGYYADYDWVVFCSLFGRMIDLPEGFPMYCRDLKQIMDENGLDKAWKQINCPDPEGEHNALVDARWNLELYRKMISDKNPERSVATEVT